MRGRDDPPPAAFARNTLAGGTLLRPLLIDGGTGTELRRRGARLDPIAWSARAAIEHFDLLTAIHKDFLDAGADVITTNTFGTARFVLDAAGLGGQFGAINRASVEAALIARERSGRDAALAGSISCLPPGFDVANYPSAAVERAAYEELATTLAELGVDLLVLEMMEDTVHACRARDAVQAVGLPYWLGVSARRSAGGAIAAYDFPKTPFGTVLDALLGDGPAPAVVNVMHTPIDAVTAALAEVRLRWMGPLGAYPEIEASEAAAGTEAQHTSGAADGGELADAGASEPGARPPSPAALAECAEEWLRAGVDVLGGCCGTTREHVRALRTLLDRLRSPRGT